MKNSNVKRVDLDRIECVYLASLRVAILGVATLCLIAAIFFGTNAAWRLLVSTDVEETRVQVSGEQVAAELQKSAPARIISDGSGDEIPAQVRRDHATWVRDFLPRYHAVYQVAAQTYKKPEDELLNPQQLMDALGYGLETFASGDEKASSLISNVGYQTQALAAVTSVMKDSAVVGQLTEYKTAGKTAEACETTYQSQRVWDPNSMVCSDWYLTPQGCEVTRSVPIQRCVPAYPQGIVSPREAFGRADQEFFRLWTQQTEQVRAEAQATRDGREATRAQIGPNLLLALQVLGAFLVVMFFFLMVAIERHLRAASTAASPVKRDPHDPAGPTSRKPSSEPNRALGPEPDPRPEPPSEAPVIPRWARRK